MLPIKLSTIAPGVTGEWGIGIHGPAGGHTIGHGGSSGALLHIDLKLELLYVIAQNTPGKGKKDEFVRACINPLDGQ
jgi:CubicO group peptidase (beta-lactamase class C family)